MNIYFVSNNEYKYKEAEMILRDTVNVRFLKMKVDEIQSQDTEKIVRDKVLKAFNLYRRPVFVEHTGLYVEEFGNLPGGLTKTVWDSLLPDKFCEIFGCCLNSPEAVARTVIGYCDGKVVHIFTGEIKGRIAPKPMGKNDFQWDCAFIPQGYNITLARLDEQNQKISMRRSALEQFRAYLKGVPV